MPFDFNTRNRRPPTDPVNALLSFAYAVLARMWTNTLTAVGFDPYRGFFHQPRYGRPALALDVMEAFPTADRRLCRHSGHQQWRGTTHGLHRRGWQRNFGR